MNNMPLPEISLKSRTIPIFQLCGVIGIVLSLILVMSLVITQHYSPWIMVAITMVALSILVGLTLLTKIIIGEERIINYHHQIVVLGSTVLLLWMIQEPILPYIDITMLGVGLFIACGRIGCLMSGCCHGRPHEWGVCYGTGHVDAGLAPYLVGVRLFPVQLMESILLFCIVLAGSLLLISKFPHGVTLTWYIFGYTIGRFFLEFLRGDAVRPYIRHFSEPQWISLIVIWSLALAEWNGWLPFSWLHLGAAILVTSIIIVVTFWISISSTITIYQILQAQHIREIVEAIEKLSQQDISASTRLQLDDHHSVAVEKTSLGIQLSASHSVEAYHYALSHQSGLLKAKTVDVLATLIVRLYHQSSRVDILCGQHNVFHLIVPK